jgi:hypothetical protein
MDNRKRGTVTLTMISLALALGSARPAYADGAASTRNIIIFGAAAAGGTAAIINHNKKVHERYAEDAANIAAAQAEARAAESDAQIAQSQARAEHNAYLKAHNAFSQEAARAEHYKKQSDTQHHLIVDLRRQLQVAQHEKEKAEQHRVSFWPW